MVTNRHIYITIFLLLITTVLFEFSTIDIKVQNYFFNFTTNNWILNSNSQPYKFIFYDGIKRVLIIFALCLLVGLILFRKQKFIIEYKRGIIIVLLSAILIPTIVGQLKKWTNMPCPYNKIEYGGKYITTKLWESYLEDFKEDKVECWPAGHASGGFALLSLFFLFKRKRAKIISLLFAQFVGWSMAIYKMAIGDHFLSHSLITMLLAWLIILLLEKYLPIKKISK